MKTEVSWVQSHSNDSLLESFLSTSFGEEGRYERGMEGGKEGGREGWREGGKEDICVVILYSEANFFSTP